MAGLSRRVVARCVALVVAATTVGSVSAVAHAGSAPAWKVGDCYASADLPASSIDLTSKVACTKDHAVQVIGGAALPSPLASAPLSELTSPDSAVWPELLDFAIETCAPAEVVGNVFGKQGKALARLLEANDIALWAPPAAGRMDFGLPDATSFAAGAEDLLCVYEPDETFSGSSAGDVRRISTRAPLETLRLCYVSRPGSGTDLTTCDETHDYQSLLWVTMPVDGLPVDLTTWGNADWAPFDEVCTDFATAVVGAKRKDLSYRADAIGSQPLIDGTHRFFNCQASPAADGAALPGGAVLTGLGKAKLKFVKS